MSSIRKDRATPPRLVDADGLASLVDGIRAGDREAAQALRGMLAPGVRFLLRQRLQSGDIDRESGQLVDAAIGEIRSDLSLRAADVLRMVRKRIQQRSGRKSAGIEVRPATGADGSAVRLAQDILGRMSTVERDALRRCYVLRQRPESFLQGLDLNPEQFRAIQSRARAEFNSSKPSKTNVA
jgi:hypothetical protein